MSPASEEAAAVRPTGSEGWISPGRFAAILAGLIFIAFPEVILGLKTFFNHDFAIFGYSLAHYHRESFWRGELPLWNPLNNCGLPFLAQWNTMALYPGSLFYLVLPLSWSLGFFCLAHQFLGGFGMYCLARRWTGNELAGAVAGVAGAFNGLIFNSLMWPNNITAFGWMPWVMLAVERGVEAGGRRLLLAAGVGAMQMSSGAPEVILFTWLVVSVFAVLTAWGSGSRRWLVLGRFAVIVVLVAALAAAQLFPFFELLRHCQRDTAYGDYGWAMPGTGWANLMIPLFRCFESRYGIHFQINQNWTTSYYFGVDVLALAIAGVLLHRHWRVWALAVITVVGLVLALGKDGGLYGVLRTAFPVVGLMNFPVKFVVLPVFCAPLLAAFAIGRLQAMSEADRRRAWRAVMVVAAVLCGVMAGLLCFERNYPMIAANWPVTLRNGLARVLFLWLLLAALWLACRAGSSSLRRWVGLGMLVLLAGDLFTHVPWQNPTIGRFIYEPKIAHDDLSPLPKPGQSRAAMDAATYEWTMMSRMRQPEALYMGFRLVLYENLNLLDDLPIVHGFYSLYLQETEQLRRVLLSSTNVPPGLYDAMAVSHVTKARQLEWQKRPGSLPVVTAGQKPIFADRRETFRAMQATDFDPRREVYLPLEARPFVPVTQAGEVKTVLGKINAHRKEIEVDASEPGLVVIAESHYPCWRASVDGQPTRLWKANHAFQAVHVPAGRHVIKLVYEDRAFQWGAWVSVATLVGCIGAWIGVGRRTLSARCQAAT